MVSFIPFWIHKPVNLLWLFFSHFAKYISDILCFQYSQLRNPQKDLNENPEYILYLCQTKTHSEAIKMKKLHICPYVERMIASLFNCFVCRQNMITVFQSFENITCFVMTRNLVPFKLRVIFSEMLDPQKLLAAKTVCGWYLLLNPLYSWEAYMQGFGYEVSFLRSLHSCMAVSPALNYTAYPIKDFTHSYPDLSYFSWTSMATTLPNSTTGNLSFKLRQRYLFQNVDPQNHPLSCPIQSYLGYLYMTLHCEMYAYP